MVYKYINNYSRVKPENKVETLYAKWIEHFDKPCTARLSSLLYHAYPT